MPFDELLVHLENSQSHVKPTPSAPSASRPKTSRPGRERRVTQQHRRAKHPQTARPATAAGPSEPPQGSHIVDRDGRAGGFRLKPKPRTEPGRAVAVTGPPPPQKRVGQPELRRRGLLKTPELLAVETHGMEQDRRARREARAYQRHGDATTFGPKKWPEDVKLVRKNYAVEATRRANRGATVNDEQLSYNEAPSLLLR